MAFASSKMTSFPTDWVICGATHRGASHVAEDKPNQDSILTSLRSDAGKTLGFARCDRRHVKGATTAPIIMAVSDGHGEERAFRSDRGSRMAVEIALDLLQEFHARYSATTDLRVIGRDAQERLPALLKARWDARVQSDLLADPFDHDVEHEMAKTEPQKLSEVVAQPVLAYGATCGAVLLTPRYVVYLMLGDPDFIVIDEDGDLYSPLGKIQDAGTTTESLCEDDAAASTMVAFKPMFGPPPVLIALSSDGVANSFATRSGFTRWIAMRLEHLKREMLETVATDLEPMLAELSKQGSGDDMSLVMLRRIDREDVAAEVLPTTGPMPRASANGQ